MVARELTYAARGGPAWFQGRYAANELKYHVCRKSQLFQPGDDLVDPCKVFPVRAREPCRCLSRRGTGSVTMTGGVSMRIRVAAVRGAAVGWWLTLVRAAKQVWTNQSTRPIRACCCLIGWLRCTRGRRGARSGCRSPDQRAGSHQLRRSAAGALLQCLHGREAASGPLRLGNARGVMRRFGGALVRDARRGRWRAPGVVCALPSP